MYNRWFIMKWAVLVVILLFSLPIISAEATSTTVTYSPNMEEIEKLNTKLVTESSSGMLAQLKTYQDENFAALDGRMQSFTGAVIREVSSSQQKMILGIIGAQLLVSGLVYFFMIKNMKDLSFQSISLKRKKETDDRNWMADNINYLRNHSDDLEANMKDVTDKLLFNMEQISAQRRDFYAGAGAGGAGGYNQGNSGDSSGFQQSSMAQQGYVQGYDQYPQGRVPNGDQYEQQVASQRQYG